MAKKKIPVVPEENKVEAIEMSKEKEIKIVKVKTPVEGSGKFSHEGQIYELKNGIIEIDEELAKEMVKTENRYWDAENKRHVIVKPYSMV